MNLLSTLHRYLVPDTARERMTRICTVCAIVPLAMLFLLVQLTGSVGGWTLLLVGSLTAAATTRWGAKFGMSEDDTDRLGKALHAAANSSDLTVRAESNDEACRNLNTFLDNTRDAVRELAMRSSSLSAAATALQSAADNLTTSESSGREQTQQIAAAARTIHSQMSDVSESSAQLESTIDFVVSSIEAMTGSVEEIATSAQSTSEVTQRATKMAASSNDSMNALGEAAREIGKVVQSISEISEQTNLLALNATVEAARAGEAGDGFTVVAHEIKQLARQAGEATEDIRRRINNIQRTSRDAVENIEQITGVVTEINHAAANIANLVAQQRQATHAIAGRLTNSRETVGNVGSAIRGATTMSHKIGENAESVSTSLTVEAEDSAAARTQQATQDLVAASQEIEALVAKFTIE